MLRRRSPPSPHLRKTLRRHPLRTRPRQKTRRFRRLRRLRRPHHLPRTPRHPLSSLHRPERPLPRRSFLTTRRSPWMPPQRVPPQPERPPEQRPEPRSR
ncbi:hypothetical protein FRC98_15970 [Lujinxingia vulgaris]|uniref:Uncharacterized protein n=1 Tax=Lujinxingia vulgaris TaxID=2600176 RepID=A0A5C6XB57_9DELT|nr:hypothetical protein FRC98_15970 [Lujinxingia vulgaris]